MVCMQVFTVFACHVLGFHHALVIAQGDAPEASQHDDRRSDKRQSELLPEQTWSPHANTVASP